MKTQLSFDLDGAPVTALIEPHHRLIDVLRDSLGQTGTREGCREGECGACTVMVDGKVINSCLFPAMEVQGARVTTITGLLEGGQLSPVQQAFVEMGGAQCGFCSPGMVMSTVALLDRSPEPNDAEIRDALTGNLCRCTGYVQIIDSIKRAVTLAASRSEEATP